MKFRTFVLLAMLAPAAQPAEPAPERERIAPSHIGLDAVLTSNAAASKDHFKTDYGSSDIHTEKNRRVLVNVRNFGREPQRVALDIVWIGKFTGSNERVILRRQSTPLALAPGAQERITGDSGEVKGSDLKLVMIGVRDTRGFKIEGWIAQLREAGEGNATGALIGLKASDTHLADLAQTRGALALLPARKQ